MYDKIEVYKKINIEKLERKLMKAYLTGCEIIGFHLAKNIWMNYSNWGR